MDATIVIMIPVLLFSVVFHEVAHGWTAYLLGDKTAARMGRLTMNPVPHIDPMMTIMMPLMLGFMTNWTVMFGGAKPVPVNPFNFDRPKRDMAITAAAGPVSNLILIIVSILLYKFLLITGVTDDVSYRMMSDEMTIVETFFLYAVLINTVLMVFNLLPIPPLDGSKILMGFLSNEQASKYEQFSRYGFYVIIGIMLLGQLINVSIIGSILNPFMNFFIELLFF